MKILCWGKSDTGQVRKRNEDSFLINEELNLFAVADGMGGHAGGEKASRLAVETLETRLGAADLADGESQGVSAEDAAGRELREAAEAAGRAIFDLAERDETLAGMGTTLTALMLYGGRAYLAHVGDSRAYLLRDNNLRQLTLDHTWIEEQVRSGFLSRDEAEQSSLKHVVTRSVGFERDVVVDVLAMPVIAGDCFFLCSDGISNHFADREFLALFNRGFYSQLPGMLVDSGNKRGGEDNMTAVVVYVGNELSK
jgi:serine/threonine protein phosphatase PrpC